MSINNKLSNSLNKLFKLSELNTNIIQETLAGITTFLTMIYVIFVHPAILCNMILDEQERAVVHAALITTTIIAIIIGTLLVAFVANAPFALAPGMGLNAFFTYSLVLGQGLPWQTALGIVFLSGVFFLILTLTGLRHLIAKAIPKEMIIASAAGIGLFLAFVGLKNMELITYDPATFVALGKLTPHALLALLGLVITMFFLIKGYKAGIIFSIIIVYTISIILGYQPLPSQVFSLPPSIKPIFGQLDILAAFNIAFIGAIFSFMFIDLFDSLSFIKACELQLKRDVSKKVLLTDASSTIIGSVLGTSTMVVFGESASGISAGARSGLSSVVIAIIMSLCLFITPFIISVPIYATAPALVIVGILMFQNLLILNLKDFQVAIPTLITIIMMPLTFSISVGLSFGFLAFTLVKCFTVKLKEISIALWIINILCIINLTI